MLNPNDLREFSPDGLDEASIDALIRDVADELAELPPATSALLDGTARTRRDRREIERTLGDTVRVLLVHRYVSDAAGTEAA
ncbi:hypothetical protein [Lentzea terrae]|uniref:hypothetical protein n=1 Tax=Lentzea terrae TaxID=2200761 RepID=UPI000DD2D82D|nr:hypothetical protein [Lentzea terrae]